MADRMMEPDHLPTTHEGIICLDLVDPLVRDFRKCESLPVDELGETLQQHLLLRLQHIEANSEEYYGHGGGPAYWASVVLRHVLFSAELPSWCDGAVGESSYHVPEDDPTFTVAHCSIKGLQASKSNEVEELRQFAKRILREKGLGEEYKVFYHETSSRLAEAVIKSPEASRAVYGSR